jgi:hypothetical protein
MPLLRRKVATLDNRFVKIEEFKGEAFDNNPLLRFAFAEGQDSDHPNYSYESVSGPRMADWKDV